MIRSPRFSRLGENCYFPPMAACSHLLASGPGWRVDDVVCTSGPQDRPFAEQHGGICIAAVTAGTFQYRSALGSAVLAPGAVLLGNDRQCFECGHEHGIGDRCLSIHFTPDHWAAIVSAVPGARRTVFAASHLPPLPALVPLFAAAEAACEDGDGVALEEWALRLGGVVAGVLAEGGRAGRLPSAHDERRITDALRRIEDEAQEPLTLAALAHEAAMSPCHFLRSFRRVVGMTPHQFLLHTRLRRAAVRLCRSEEPVSAIAFDLGFGDLSTFNRRFRRVMGESPSAYRAARRRRSRHIDGGRIDVL